MLICTSADTFCDGSAAYQKMLKQRSGLPAYQRKDMILKLIRDNRVIVLSGETGCGKTTQLPQMVLEDMMQKKQVRCFRNVLFGCPYSIFGP